MIPNDSPEHKKFIEQENDKNYSILVEKLPPGEEIQCSDDSDMTVSKEKDGAVLLTKKCFTKKCFF